MSAVLKLVPRTEAVVVAPMYDDSRIESYWNWLADNRQRLNEYRSKIGSEQSWPAGFFEHGEWIAERKRLGMKLNG